MLTAIGEQNYECKSFPGTFNDCQTQTYLQVRKTPKRLNRISHK